MTFYAFCVVLVVCWYNVHCRFTYKCKIPSGSGVNLMPKKCTVVNKSHKVGPFFILESLGTVNTFHSDKMVAWSLGRGLLKFQIVDIFFFLHSFIYFCCRWYPIIHHTDGLFLLLPLSSCVLEASSIFGYVTLVINLCLNSNCWMELLFDLYFWHNCFCWYSKLLHYYEFIDSICALSDIATLYLYLGSGSL